MCRSANLSMIAIRGPCLFCRLKESVCNSHGFGNKVFELGWFNQCAATVKEQPLSHTFNLPLRVGFK